MTKQFSHLFTEYRGYVLITANGTVTITWRGDELDSVSTLKQAKEIVDSYINAR